MKELKISVASSVITALIIYLSASLGGVLEKSISTAQKEDIYQMLRNDDVFQKLLKEELLEIREADRSWVIGQFEERDRDIKWLKENKSDK
ncbi:MAG: hypothetical protein CL693_18350 [Cellvibrionaceae bacterium]|nr:hypothetical protein [Cellvibrionaceae bacterium]|tara:strand:+ start:19528 stop:19800 length:273 start_codon:yes stop_codon:yes gene_type:complete